MSCVHRTLLQQIVGSRAAVRMQRAPLSRSVQLHLGFVAAYPFGSKIFYSG